MFFDWFVVVWEGESALGLRPFPADILGVMEVAWFIIRHVRGRRFRVYPIRARVLDDHAQLALFERFRAEREREWWEKRLETFLAV